MNALRDGEVVTVTMTTDEADALEAEIDEVGPGSETQLWTLRDVMQATP